MTRLNLGCGNAYLDGYVNIDKDRHAHADLFLDLDGEPWEGIEDGSVTEIIATHVFEHFDDLCWVMKECYRVMQPGALLHITTPHQHSDGYYGDPTHVRPITLAQLELFSKSRCAEFKAKGWPNTPLAEYHEVDFEVVSVQADLTPAWANRGLNRENLDFCIASYNGVVDQVRFVLRRVDDGQ